MLQIAIRPALQRKQEVIKLIDAATRHDARQFAELYDAYLGPDKDAEVVRLIDAARADDTVTLDELYDQFLGGIAEHGPITDQQVRRYLRASRVPNPQAREDLYDRLSRRLRTLSQSILYPVFEAPEKQDAANPTSSAISAAEANGLWGELIDDAGAAAERIWRDYFLNVPPQAKREFRAGRLRRFRQGHSDGSAYSAYLVRMRALEALTRRARLLMLLWLEASLYNIRSGSNFAGRTTTAGSARGENPTRKQIRDIVQQYRKTLKGWDDELRALTGQRFFRIGSLDSQVYRIFVKKFGTFADEELGWDAQAADARSELRYQLFEEIRRERLRSRRFAAASAFWGLKKTSGYGTQPHLFIRSGLTILGLFTGLFFLNDYLNPGIGSSKHFCTVVTVQFTNWYDWPLNLARYLYVAVTNLSSLGSNSDVAHLCPGTFTQVLLIASALTGYFLLAMLAALFFRLLTESES